MPLRKSEKIKKPAISSNHLCFLQESESDFGDTDDPTTYKQAVESTRAHLWHTTMLEELDSMKKNRVWSLVQASQKAIGCKWIFKTKRNAKGLVKRYKARLVAKGFTQREG